MPSDSFRLLRLDLQTIIAGVLLPAAGVAVDSILLGQGIVTMAPAGLLTAMALGIGAMLLSAWVATNPAAAVLAGVVTAASLVVWAIALPLAAMSAYGAYFVVHGVTDRGAALLVVLGLSTLWTAWVFMRRAWKLIAASRADSPAKALLLGILGAAGYLAIVFAADRGERAWLTAQVAPITKEHPERWPGVFTKLQAYPFCGPVRCRQLVCDRLYEEFGTKTTTGTYVLPDVPAEHEDMLAFYLGNPSSKECPRVDDYIGP